MKKLILLVLVLNLGVICYAQSPFIPENLTNKDYKPTKVDCNSSSNFGFIPSTIPNECKSGPKLEAIEQPKPTEQNNTSDKINKFLNILL